MSEIPGWLIYHRANRPYDILEGPKFETEEFDGMGDNLARVAPTAFNNHTKNTGAHVSPFDTGLVRVGTAGLEVRLAQGIDLERLQQVVAAGTQATIGRSRPEGPGPMSDLLDVADADWQEMFKGGLQTALESQTLVFEVWGASRVLTHQLVRSRRAGFHQQSQRSTWYGDRPEVRMPETVWRSEESVRRSWNRAYSWAWKAYREACDAGVPYEDARYILPEGTVNYIQCEYTLREFMNVFAYRGCSMFLREMVVVMRAMRSALLAQAPWMEPYVKISCEKTGADCQRCKGSGWVFTDGVAADPAEVKAHLEDPNEREVMGCWQCSGKGSPDRKCTFQGWENVELACDFPWALEGNRTFLANPKLRIGA